MSARPRMDRWLLAASCLALSIACGSDDVGTPLSSIEREPERLPQIAGWVSVTAMPEARMQAGAAALDGIIYVAGGVSPSWMPQLEILAYDTRTDTWRVAGALIRAARSPAVVALGGLIHVIGGSHDNPWQPHGSLQILDPATGQVVLGPPMPTARLGLSAVALDGRIHAIGGVYQWDPADLVMGEWADFHEVYDPATGVWSTRAPIRAARGGHGAAVVAGRIHVVGGYPLQMEIYDPAHDAWTSASAPEGGFGTAVGGDGARIYVVGGSAYPAECCGGPVTHGRVHRYDPAAQRWETLAPLPAVTNGHAVAVSDGVVYAMGGSPTGAFSLARATTLRYRPQ